MGPGENVLIVEDEAHWRSIYEQFVQAQVPGQTVSMAQDRLSAERLIEAAKFAVAFVDVSLDPDDARNADGLKVMKKIRDSGDETSIIVVTGRSGQDVLRITRDAIKEYDAFETLGKSTFEPDTITEVLEKALQAYREKSAAGRETARDALLSGADPIKWDDEVTRAVGFTGHMGQFNEFLTGLFGAYLPIVARRGNQHAHVDREVGLVHGAYWSRAIAAAVVICFGSEKQLQQAIEAAGEGGRLFGEYKAGRQINRLAQHGVGGAVFLLEEGRREDFGQEPGRTA